MINQLGALKYTRRGDDWTHQDTASYNWRVAEFASSSPGHRLAMVYQVFNSDAMEYTTNVLVFRCVEVEGVQMIVGLGESTETADLMFFKLNTADWTLTSMSANQPLLLTMGP